MKDATLRPSDSCVGDLAEGLGGEPGGEDAGDPVAAALVTDPARGAVQPRVIAADVLLPELKVILTDVLLAWPRTQRRPRTCPPCALAGCGSTWPSSPGLSSH